MRKTITATEANRQFARVLSDVKKGIGYTVTSHGKPVAKLVAGNTNEAEERARKATAFQELLEHLDQQPVRDIGAWTRDELYQDEA